VNQRALEAGQTIDDFRLLERLPSGGMASFWRVARDGDDRPMLMKIPLLRPGEDPLTIIGYEVEQMVLPRLTGPHVPRFIAAGDFEEGDENAEEIDVVHCAQRCCRNGRMGTVEFN
jgi:eukaryotic-like serine/threonine-protein kinase